MVVDLTVSFKAGRIFLILSEVGIYGQSWMEVTVGSHASKVWNAVVVGATVLDISKGAPMVLPPLVDGYGLIFRVGQLRRWHIVANARLSTDFTWA
jgi:hypothetical protein